MKRELLKESLEVKQPDAPAPSGYVPPPARRGKVMLNVPVEKAVRDQVRALAIELGTTAQALMYEGLNDLFSKYGKKPIA